MRQHDEQTHAIIGAAMEVHNILGPGFLEAVYHDAMMIELEQRGISAVREVPAPVRYKGEVLGASYRVDILCHGDIIVELKAIKAITPIELAQLINYLHATGHQRGLLFNFGASHLEFERRVLNY
jgi:GxxExxY protein